jgi:dTDP-4-amino-4,6-dideoxygalactose transaminase
MEIGIYSTTETVLELLGSVARYGSNVHMKNSINDLALFGGEKAFRDLLHVGRPNIGLRKSFEERIADILDHRWFTNAGRYVKEFEEKVCSLLGVRHCIAMCNGTVALEIAIRALNLRGEVIIPSFTFIATANALQWQEITPVFCDIDPLIHNIDPDKVEKMITPKTSGIVGVHIWGRPCNIDALEEIAQRRRLKLLFDSAHAFGCTYKGKMIGSFGDAEVFSFHATKFVNTLEGGAVVTNHDEVAHKVRFMKNFGFADYDRTEYIGVNGKMNEISAAMGLTNIESMDEFIVINHRNYLQYRSELAGLPGISVIEFDEKERSNYQYVVLEVDEKEAGISRDLLVKALHEEGILARRYFYPGCHRMEPYRSLFPHAGLMLPETERLVERVICLPTGTVINEAEINGICKIIRLIIGNGTDIRRMMKAKG